MPIEYMDTAFYILGKAVVILGLLILMVGRFFAARLMLISISLLENVIKAIFYLARADDAIVDDVGVRLRNYINRKKFHLVPYNSRFIFMPQCVRSADCPAKLTPEGIKCINCGRCSVGEAKKFAEGLGYRFFIVPGSSFIKRIIKKYRPKAIVGVGCQMEIKEGLDMCHSYDIPAIGVPLSQAGCVSTVLDWEKLYDEISDQV
jgi:hypothetical protein